MAIPLQQNEQILINIMRLLPKERVQQLLDFACFLELQCQRETQNRVENEVGDTEWDTLLASNKAQTLLENLAAEALAEHKSGNTTPLQFHKGKIVR